MKKIMSVLDPALDLLQMNAREYADGGTRDEGLVRELPGRTATRFHVRPLSVEESLACDSQTSPVYKLRLVICYALVRVDRGGGVVLVPGGSRSDGGTKRPYWLDDEYRELARLFGKLVLLEVAMVIAEMDEALGEAFRGDDAERYTLPPLSRDALARRERQLAAQSQAVALTPRSDA